MRPNPSSTDHAPGSAVRRAIDDFNRTYCTILDLLQKSFNGNPALLAVPLARCTDSRRKQSH